MMRQYLIDLKRGIVNSRFLAAVLLCAAIYWLGSLPEIGADNVLYILDATVAFGSFYHLFPVVAVFPFVASFLEDLHSGNLRFTLQRIDGNRYLARRFLVTGVVGGLATALGMLAFLGVLLPVTHPLASLDYAEAVYPYAEALVQQKQWVAYFGLYALLQWASGFMWAGIGLMFSAIAGKMQLVYLATALFMEVLCRGLFAIDKEHIVIYAMGGLDVETIGQLLLESLSIFAILSLISFLVFMVFGKRRLRYA